MIRFTAIALLLFASPALAKSGACPPVGAWLDAVSERVVPADQALARLAEADVILLGERHGFPDVHLWQATTAAMIGARRGKAQYAYEMLPRAAQPALDAWALGRTSRAAFLAAANWPAVWGFPADAYDPILRLPRLQAAPAIALNVERELVRRVGRDGWAAVPVADRSGLGDPAPASPAYRARLDAVFDLKTAGAAPGFAERHGETADAAAEPATMRARFVEAQLVWDRAFGEGIAAGLAARPGLPVIAFMGSGHVEYGHGVARQLADLGVVNVVSAIAVFVGEDCGLERDDVGAPVADYVYGLPASQPEPDAPERPRIGVFIQDAGESGAEITQVSPGSPAEAAGFKSGDVVKTAAGRTVAGAGDLGAAIRAHSWGAWLPFAVSRGGEMLELVVKLPPAPPS